MAVCDMKPQYLAVERACVEEHVNERATGVLSESTDAGQREATNTTIAQDKQEMKIRVCAR